MRSRRAAIDPRQRRSLASRPSRSWGVGVGDDGPEPAARPRVGRRILELQGEAPFPDALPACVARGVGARHGGVYRRDDDKSDNESDEPESDADWAESMSELGLPPADGKVFQARRPEVDHAHEGPVVLRL